MNPSIATYPLDANLSWLLVAVSTDFVTATMQTSILRPIGVIGLNPSKLKYEFHPMFNAITTGLVLTAAEGILVVKRSRFSFEKKTHIATNDPIIVKL